MNNSQSLENLQEKLKLKQIQAYQLGKQKEAVEKEIETVQSALHGAAIGMQAVKEDLENRPSESSEED